MHTRLRRSVLLVILWVVACADHETSLCELTGLLQRFEPPYKMSLYFTGQEEHDAAVAALDQAIAHWDSIYTRFASEPPPPFGKDPGWSDGISTIRGHLVGARDLIQDGQALQAHERLEEIRRILADLRERNGVVALMDRLTRFHDPMERIVHLAATKTTEDLSDAVLDSMAAILPELEAAWDKVAGFPADRIVHGRASGFAWQVERETETLITLKEALRKKDRQTILDMAPKLKQTFMAIFLNFG